MFNIARLFQTNPQILDEPIAGGLFCTADEKMADQYGKYAFSMGGLHEDHYQPSIVVDLVGFAETDPARNLSLSFQPRGWAGYGSRLSSTLVNIRLRRRFNSALGQRSKRIRDILPPRTMGFGCVPENVSVKMSFPKNGTLGR